MRPQARQATLPCLLSLAAALLVLVGCSSSTDDDVAPVYDGNTAFILAGQEMPAGEHEFYLFDFDQDQSVARDADDILRALDSNPLDSHELGLIGPDAAHNLAVARRLNDQRGADSYPQARLVYVGPDRHRAEVTTLLAPLVGELRYVVYP